MLTNLNGRQTSKDSDIWFEWDKCAKDHPPVRSLSECSVLLLLFRIPYVAPLSSFPLVSSSTLLHQLPYKALKKARSHSYLISHSMVLGFRPGQLINWMLVELYLKKKKIFIEYNIKTPTMKRTCKYALPQMVLKKQACSFNFHVVQASSVSPGSRL